MADRTPRKPGVAELFEQARSEVTAGSLTRWMRDNVAELEAQCVNGRMDWKLFMSVVARLDLRDRAGRVPTLASVQKAWKRLQNTRPPLRRPRASRSRTQEQLQSGPLHVETPVRVKNQPSVRLPDRSPEPVGRSSSRAGRQRLQDIQERLGKSAIPMPPRPE